MQRLLRVTVVAVALAALFAARADRGGWRVRWCGG